MHLQPTDVDRAPRKPSKNNWIVYCIGRELAALYTNLDCFTN